MAHFSIWQCDILYKETNITQKIIFLKAITL